MSRLNLIDKDALIKHLKQDPLFPMMEQYGITGVIESRPTIDAVEVVHGEWMRYGEHGEPNSIDTCIWQCDKCLETYYGRTERIPNYCPNCGAKMDGEVKDNG